MCINGVILVVEDDADILNLTSLRLRRAGYEVMTALSHTAAMSAARSRAPDLAVVDLLLGGDDGWQVICDLRRLEGCEALPVVVQTVLDVDRPRPDVVVTAILTKPVGKQRLERVVEEALGAGRLRGQPHQKPAARMA
ncbi:response regulator [Acidiferrimicrobium sp. IK]|uniref:response regulator n=1 Tax=Acidiferrimicrobium sp. IK TaxID=2871700 RepID=UPI0021CB093D|nr:response regulator [Acidiferrimicrobium sp. IK]MCU4184543.1 response regulator [Acidiferrimicrobium sp. IK]